MKGFRAVCCWLFVCLASEASAQGILIDHDGVGCVVADKFPRLEARFDPADKIAKARLHFRSEGGMHWWSVLMKKIEGDVFVGVLPKPEKALKSFNYYIEVTDASLATSRTQEYTPSVASGPAACKDKVVAGSVASAAVVVEAPAGAPSIPAGFSSAGAAAAGTGAAAGAAAAAAGAAGGGLTTLAVVGIVAGVAAIATGVAVAASGGEELPTGGEELPTGTFRGSATPFTTSFNNLIIGEYATCTWTVTHTFDIIELTIDDLAGTVRVAQSQNAPARSSDVDTRGNPCGNFEFRALDLQFPATVSGAAVTATGTTPLGSLRLTLQATRGSGGITGTIALSDNNPGDNSVWGSGSGQFTATRVQ